MWPFRRKNRERAKQKQARREGVGIGSVYDDTEEMDLASSLSVNPSPHVPLLGDPHFDEPVTHKHEGGDSGSNAGGSGSN